MNSGQTPVTVLVPVYNAESTISRGMQSILAMARAQDEILVIDDGSADKSLFELQKFSRMDNRVNLISRSHQGLVDVLNFGLLESSNELIARADIDDTYRPDRLDFQLDAMSRSSEISAVFSDYEISNARGVNLGVIPTAFTENLTRLSLINHQRTAHPSVVFRKESVKAVGGYRKSDFPAEDYALWIRLSEFSKIHSVPRILLNYTLSPNGISLTGAEAMKKKTSLLQIEFARTLDVDMYRNCLVLELSKLSELAFSWERKLLTIRDFITLLTLKGHSYLDITREISNLHFGLELIPTMNAFIKLELQRRKRGRERG